MADPLLSVRNLSVQFRTARGWVTAVEGVTFDVHAGHTVGIVGESGSGKSVTALSLLRLLPRESARVLAGQVIFEGTDLLGVSGRVLRGIRGRRIAMVFQEPMSSLNPLLSIGHQIAEPLRLHLGLRGKAVRQRALELLARVRITPPELWLTKYPHQLSGGMRQRVMIAMALACHPKLLIADEPTTALDVTTQAQILDLLRELQRELQMAILIITHDLGIIAEFAGEVQVMYAGRLVERAPVQALFERAAHPYTEALLKSMPQLEGNDGEPLLVIDGTVPSLTDTLPGCSFHPRCRYARPICTAAVPRLRPFEKGQVAACVRDIDERRREAAAP